MATTSQVVTSSLPAAFEEFYKTGVKASGTEGTPGYQPEIKGLIPQAFELYGKGTPADFKAQYVDPLQAAGLYGSGRVAELSDFQKKLGTELGGMKTPGQFSKGTGSLDSAYDILSGGLPSLLDQGLVKQYMSPYVQNVLDIQKQKAIEDAQKTQLTQNLAAARRGAYGGSRQLLATTEREKILGQGLAEIQAKGLQSAYEAAQKGLEAERTAKLQQGQYLGTLGQQYGTLGVQQQAADIDRLKTMGAYGDLQRAIDQQKIDARYQDLLKSIGFPEQQLEKLSAFIRGIPMTDQTTATTTPTPSFASQLTGMGLVGLGLGK